MEYEMTQQNIVHEFACQGPIDVRVRIGAGDLSVMAEATSTAVVHVMPADGSRSSQEAAEHTRVTFSGDTLQIEAPERSGWRNGRVRVEARVPTDSRLRAGLGSADVRTEGQLGAAIVHTGSGDAMVRITTGDLQVESGSGDVSVGTVGGALRVKTGSGDISADTVTGAVSVKAASGDIRLGAVGGDVEVTSASGDIGLGTVRSGNLKINSASGDVSVGVPTGTSVWLDLSTVSGSTDSDLAMTGDAPDGGPALSLRVNTVSGDIRVHRVAA
jgi:DUF4097 and DUF4098 domain-containing protein YvlB